MRRNQINTQKTTRELGAVAHICNPSYSEGRDQEHCGARLAREKIS
jgi:hypothetical protein